AVSHWSITRNGDGASDDWTVGFAKGVCTVGRGHEGEPRVSLTMSPESFAKVASKSGNPAMMFMMGKIKASGDLGLAANIANLFNVPEA
ncbi:MAG: SCP2 sterol-binding domain-containing protein, partial [Nostocoides sp.]